MSSMSGRTPGPATEKDFDNLVDYSHYVAVTNLRCKGGAEDTAVDEKLFEIAHFMLKSSSWDPFKQSLLAISLIEKKGPEASEMWSKLLFPLERAYDATSGAEFKDRFGHPFFEPQCAVVLEAEEEEEKVSRDAPRVSSSSEVASTRSHCEAILTAMSALAIEAGQPTDTAAQARAKGILTPKEKAELDALKKAKKRKEVEIAVMQAKLTQTQAEAAAVVAAAQAQKAATELALAAAALEDAEDEENEGGSLEAMASAAAEADASI
mmetsp:Transcript_21041/g.41696  ORF Transcript_21041/g.41696 Transcript_21041/m.41696 type:complete len:266 (-) Transcript_21041:369-1166(-)